MSSEPQRSPEPGGRRDLLRAGDRFGVYEIVECLGMGGMGVVYRALHTLIERTVALKILCSPEGIDPGLVRRFFGEAKAVNRVTHENIIEVTDLLYHDGRYGLVMECLVGESLDVKIDRDGYVPVEQVVPIVLQTARAMEAAHAAGVLHLDLSPGNIFVLSRGRGDFVKVLDFGLCNVGAPKPSQKVAFGTPNYMAPEQARAARCDGRTDIYAVGALMFEALTGRVVFVRDSSREVLRAHVLDQPRFPPPGQRPQEIPPPLERLVLQCLKKNPDDRPQSMTELASLLIDVEQAIVPAPRLAAPAQSHDHSSPTDDRSSIDRRPVGRSWSARAISGAVGAIGVVALAATLTFAASATRQRAQPLNNGSNYCTLSPTDRTDRAPSPRTPVASPERSPDARHPAFVRMLDHRRGPEPAHTTDRAGSGPRCDRRAREPGVETARGIRQR